MQRTIIDLERFAREGHPGLTAVEAASLVEAACVCADHVGHPLPQIISLSGARRLRPQILGPVVDNQMRRTHADIQDATERGAMALAISVLATTHQLVVYERSPKNGYGFDYYLGPAEEADAGDGDGNFFADATHTVEVSGTTQDDPSELSNRVTAKVNRLRTRRQPFPAFVFVFDFFRIRARLVQPRMRLLNGNG